MPKFINVKNRVMMEVKPVASLLKSTLISEVVKGGRKFVVDMNTGSLTIYDPKDPVKADVEKVIIDFVLCFNNQEIYLSNNLSEALIQIEELLADKGYARLQVIRNWKILGIAQYLGSRGSFERMVTHLYSKYGN